MTASDPQHGCPTLEALDAAASGSASAALSDHLTECPRCRRRLERVRADQTLLGEIAALGDPAESGRGRVTVAGLASVPGYDVREELHRGGQGVVFRAVQTATKREVALKVLLHGTLATSLQRRRFEREIELAASLHHPNIVTLHDSGMTPDGRCYFSMALVRGCALDAALAQEMDVRLTPKGRLHRQLALFERICAAIAFAHQRGVIHRDLKPANILVDDRGEPVIVDFGLARLARDGDELTRTGAFGGSLAYASPEHLLGDPDAVDVRSDVYALGVMLYELLSGTRPYPLDGGLADVVRAITSVTPRRLRGAVHPRHGWRVDRELEAIALKALEKNQQRRYSAAGALAQDVRRYLDGQPVAARGDSTLYVLRKAARRHWAASLAAGAAVVAVTAFGAVTAVKNREIAAEARRAAKAEAEATRSARSAERVTDYLVDMFDPFGYDADVDAVRQIVDAAAANLDEFQDDPQPLAATMDALGTAYFKLGLYAPAERLLRDALAARREVFPAASLPVAQSLARLAELRQAQSEYAEADALLLESIQALEALGGDALELARVLTIRAGVRVDLGDLDGALASVERALEIERAQLAGDDITLAYSLNNLGYVLLERGSLAESEVRFREALAMRRRLLPPDHPLVSLSLDNLAGVVTKAGRYEEGIGIFEQSLALRRRRLGPRHPQVAMSLHYMGWALQLAGRFEEAEARLAEALVIRHERLPPDHADIGRTHMQLGQTLLRAGRAREAQAEFEQAIRIFDAVPESTRTPRRLARELLEQCRRERSTAAGG